MAIPGLSRGCQRPLKALPVLSRFPGFPGASGGLARPFPEPCAAFPGSQDLELPCSASRELARTGIRDCAPPYVFLSRPFLNCGVAYYCALQSLRGCSVAFPAPFPLRLRVHLCSSILARLQLCLSRAFPAPSCDYVCAPQAFPRCSFSFPGPFPPFPGTLRGFFLDTALRGLARNFFR